jgi:hypothetical protein
MSGQHSSSSIVAVAEAAAGSRDPASRLAAVGPNVWFRRGQTALENVEIFAELAGKDFARRSLEAW